MELIYDLANIIKMMKLASSNSTVDVVAGLDDDYLDSVVEQALEIVLGINGIDAKKISLVKVLTEYKALSILWASSVQYGISDFKAKDLSMSVTGDGNQWESLYKSTLADFGISSGGWGIQIG